MTKIDELMALAEDYAQECKDFGHISDSLPKQALKQALEAALKPGEPHHWIVPEFGFLFPTEDAARRYLENIGSQAKPTACYTAAPPAQTPVPHGWWIAQSTPEKLNLWPTDADALLRLSAPPAQTPPRLADEQISEIAVNNPPNVHTYGRAIETAVRRQWAKQFGVNDE